MPTRPSVLARVRRAMRINGTTTSWPAGLLQAILLGAVYALLSTPAAYTSNQGTLAAIIWPAPAVAVALLWTTPWQRWWIFLLAIFAAMLYVGDADALSVGTDTAFAVLNVFQVCLYVLLGRHLVSANGNIDSTRTLTRYVLFLPLLGTAAVAALGATIGHLTKNTSWLEEWRVMLVGNGLAILVLLPALRAWCADRGQVVTPAGADSKWTVLGATGLAALLVTGSALVPAFPAEILRALLALVLVGAAIRGGLRAASLGLLTAATLGIGFTLAGLGPYGAQQGQDGVWHLQIDLAGLAFLSFFVAIAVDERHQINLRLDRARRFETMGFLTGGIAHDFNNILGAVGGYAELAMERAETGLGVEAPLKEVSAAVARGRDLTEQLLLAGRRGGRNREAADLRDIACEAVALAVPLLPAGIALSMRVPPDAVMVMAHRGQLTRAILNLLRNAGQAASSTVDLVIAPPSGDMPQPDIVIGDFPDAGCTWLEVRDDGPGIPPSHMGQLFDPFFSVRPPAGGKTHGTGLGLPIVAGVATDHEGGVAVWRRQEQETVFRLGLPLAVMAPAADGGAAAEPLAHGQIAMVLSADPAAIEEAENRLAELGFEPEVRHPAAAPVTGAIADPEGNATLALWIGHPAGEAGSAGLQPTHLPGTRTVVWSPHSGSPGVVLGGGLVTIAGPLNSSALAIAVTMAGAGQGLQPRTRECPVPD